MTEKVSSHLTHATWCLVLQLCFCNKIDNNQEVFLATLATKLGRVYAFLDFASDIKKKKIDSFLWSEIFCAINHRS